MTTLERIHTEAIKISRGWLDVQKTCAIDSYRRGAESERNKVLDEIIEQVNAFPMFPENRKEWLTYLFSLKV